MNFTKPLMALSIAAAASLALAVPTPVSAQSERALEIGRLAKKAGVQESFEKATKNVRKAEKFIHDLNEFHSKIDIGKLESGLKVLGTLSEHAGYLGAAVDLALIFVPDAPDPVMVALDNLQRSVNEMHKDMLVGFVEVTDKTKRDILDLAVKDATDSINGYYISYLNFMEVLERSGDDPSPNYLDGMRSISDSGLNKATSGLANLCTGSDLFDGSNIFDAHLVASHGDITTVIRIGQYILMKITQAQTAQGARIMYASTEDLTAAATKRAVDVANEKHAKFFDQCLDRLQDTIDEFKSANSLKSYARNYLENYPHRDLSAKAIGRNFQKRFPMWEWVIVAYDHKEIRSDSQKDHRKENWDGEQYVKRLVHGKKQVIAAYFPKSDAGFDDGSGCERNLIRYNALLHDSWMKTGQRGKNRKIIQKHCSVAADESPLVWASNKLRAQIWTSDPLSVHATARKNLEHYARQNVKYAIVGTDRRSCSGIDPKWSRLVGVGGRSAHAMFVTNNNKVTRYYHNSPDPRDNCFTSRPMPYDAEYSIDDISPKISAVLDFTKFPKKGDRWGKNIAFLQDGTYHSYSAKADYDDDVEIGVTSEAWPGISAEQSKMIVGAAAWPTRGKVYFFYDDGNYSRFDIKKGKVDQKLNGISRGWPGVRPDIVAVADFEKTNDAMYFFYDDGQYARFDMTKRRVTYEGASSGWK